MTSAVMLNWFNDMFVPDAKVYCENNNLAFKLILIMDNAPSHLTFHEGRHPDVRVVFLTPNTTSVVQPLDQEFISNVKVIYCSKSFHTMEAATDTGEEEHLTELELDENGEVEVHH